jgi:cholera toxin transcriptional activator
MIPPAPARRYRFATFEADATTGELRRQGIRIRLAAQPFQLLLLLLERPGDLITRDDIARQLWPTGTFVDYEHGVNSAINRIREALGDTAASPRFVETLARRGYRFLAPVEHLESAPVTRELPTTTPVILDLPTTTPVILSEGRSPKPKDPEASHPATTLRSFPPHPANDLPLTEDFISGPFSSILASPAELPAASPTLVRTLFLLLQAMYLGFYIGALANLPEIDGLLAYLPHSAAIFITLIVTAAALIPARAFILCMVLFRAPRAATKFLKLWPFLLPLDILWSLSPFLLLHHIDFGVALACTALLVYSPFAQRALTLMGAAEPRGKNQSAFMSK